MTFHGDEAGKMRAKLIRIIDAYGKFLTNH